MLLRAVWIASLCLVLGSAAQAGGFDMRSCPLDRLVFVDRSSGTEFQVESVHEDEFYVCENGKVREPADPSQCNGPFRHTILSGGLGQENPAIKMSFVWHVMWASPGMGWSSFMPSDQQLKQLISGAERLDGSDMPTLGDRHFESIVFAEGAQLFTLNKAYVTPNSALVPLACR